MDNITQTNKDIDNNLCINEQQNLITQTNKELGKHLTHLQEKRIETSIIDNPEIVCPCYVCKKDKIITDFHSFSYNINNNISHTFYIKNLCKECLPEKYIIWNKAMAHPIIDYTNFNKFFQENEILKFEQTNNINFKDLINRTEALKILNLSKENRGVLQNKVKDGIIKEYKINYICPIVGTRGKIVNLYKKYYLASEINGLKYIMDNGFLLRTDKKESINTNLPNIICGHKYNYLFVNLTNRTKTCIDCYQTKSVDDFHGGSTRDKKCNYCKSCCRLVTQEYYHGLSKERKIENKEKYKLWRKENAPLIRKYNKKYNKKPKVKIIRNIRERLRDFIEIAILQRNKNILPYSKKQFNEEFGCSKKYLLEYLESKFLSGMTWDNYGSGFKIDELGKVMTEKQWSIDHIRCVSSFDLTKEEERIKINHYTNLLPMWNSDNSIKKDRTEFCKIYDAEFLQKYKELEILAK